jgi:aspartate carbamoyltransferase catalytic subunit
VSKTLLSAPGARVRTSEHLVDAGCLDRELVEYLLAHSAVMEGVLAEPEAAPLHDKILATLFFEPSTRTRLSFEAAMLRLGGQVISAADPAGLSAAKGESLEDTIRIVGGYADAIVLRHPQVGAAARAAGVSRVPVINGGDGAGQHPTQALLDLYTIKKELGRLDHLRIGLAGDIKHGRTVHSLALLLSLFAENEIVLIAPPGLGLPADLREALSARGAVITETAELEPAVPDLDVLYQTRLQRERLAGIAFADRLPRVDDRLLGLLQSHAIVMHPLPRVDEIDPAIDADPRAAYFRQAANGLPVRMAILHWLICGR